MLTRCPNLVAEISQDHLIQPDNKVVSQATPFVERDWVWSQQLMRCCQGMQVLVLVPHLIWHVYCLQYKQPKLRVVLGLGPRLPKYRSEGLDNKMLIRPLQVDSLFPISRPHLFYELHYFVHCAYIYSLLMVLQIT